MQSGHHSTVHSDRAHFRLHRGYLHEVWIDEHEGLESCVALGPAGDAARSLMGKSTCVWVFWAKCHLDAMNTYCEFLDRGAYDSNEPWDREDYPLAWYIEQEAHLAAICTLIDIQITQEDLARRAASRDFSLMQLPGYMQWSKRKLLEGESPAFIAHLDSQSMWLHPDEVAAIGVDVFEEFLSDLKDEIGKFEE